jgi:hypothetical protein
MGISDKSNVSYLAGVIADVLVTQVYKNEGRESLEAVYIFSASTRAAVYEMKMTIGKRVIEAQIKKREEVRREYEQARKRGKTASLLAPKVTDLFAERPVVVFGKWRGKPQGKITLSGLTGEGAFQAVLEAGAVKPAPVNSGLRYLWARHKITLLSDYNLLRADDRRVREVTELGLRYNLLTAYTSFVAIDTETRNLNGKPILVRR